MMIPDLDSGVRILVDQLVAFSGSSGDSLYLYLEKKQYKLPVTAVTSYHKWNCSKVTQRQTNSRGLEGGSDETCV